MTQQVYRGQVVSMNTKRARELGVHCYWWISNSYQISATGCIFPYLVYNPFVQLSYNEYPKDLRHLQRRNLIQCISKSKFLNCIYRDGTEDIDDGIYVSFKFGKRPVVLNAERTHCYFSHKGRFYKSKVWTDKLGVVYGACAGSQYGEYDGKL